MISRRLSLLATAGTMALLLAGCGDKKQTEETTVETNIVTDVETATPVENIAIPTPTPTPTPLPAPTPVATGPDFSDTEQTEVDADATGLTSRVSRGQDNETAPAQ